MHMTYIQGFGIWSVHYLPRVFVQLSSVPSNKCWNGTSHRPWPLPVNLSFIIILQYLFAIVVTINFTVGKID